MKVEKVIEALNNYIRSERELLNIDYKGFLVLQKTIAPCPAFPVYKRYSFILWLVDESGQHGVLTFNHQTKEDKELVMEYIEGEFVNHLIPWMMQCKSLTTVRTMLEDIIYGEYTNPTERISDTTN